MNKFLQSNKNYIILVVFAFICYHFLWYNASSMKWDMAEQYLPWRYFLAKCLQNNTLPFWNPFQNGGYPTFADPQSAIWYYPAWAIGIISGYNMSIIQLEVLGFVILSGLGFYKLAIKLGYSKQASLLVSSAYMCSGFIVGNAQHMTWVAAAAWIPWLFYYYIFIRKNIISHYLAWFLVVLYLYISSSYPAFVIVSAYIIAIDQIILFIKSDQKLKFIQQKILFLLSCILICLPIIYSLVISKDYFSRGDGITLLKALQNPFSWQSLLSFISPFSSFKNTELFKTDISMSNAYIGLLPVLLFTTSIFFIKNKRSILWLALFFLFLLIGFGSQTPLRAWLYNFLPGFNLFRFPALFRLFSIIFLLLYVAEQYDYFVHQFDIQIKKFRLILFTILILFIGIITIHINNWHPFQFLSLTSLEKSFESTSFIQHLIFQLAIQSIVILFLLLLYNKKTFTRYIILVVFLDLFISVRLNSVATMVHSHKSKLVDELIVNASKKFHTPRMQELHYSIDQQYEYRWPLNWNMNCYFGEIAIDGYNPFILKTYNTLSDSKLRDSIWKSAWYYCPKYLFNSDTPNVISSNTAWYNSEKKDTLFFDQNIQIVVREFNPNQLIFDYDTRNTSALVLAQSPFPGWSATIDQHPTDILTVNYSQQLIKLLPGKHTIIWKFENQLLNWMLYVHLFIFFVLLGFASLKSFGSMNRKSNTF